MNDAQSLQKQFKDLLVNQNFEEAEEMLLKEVYEVEDKMDDISEERYQEIEKHWSAVETGEVITTPLDILFTINQKAQFTKGASLVDLGSGHGFPCLVFSVLNPSMSFLGIDVVKEKVDGATKSANKLGLTNIEFITQDLASSSYKIPEADYYYIHNPFNDEVCKYVIKTLSGFSTCKIISTNGRETKYLKNFGFKDYLEIKPYEIRFYSL